MSRTSISKENEVNAVARRSGHDERLNIERRRSSLCCRQEMGDAINIVIRKVSFPLVLAELAKSDTGARDQGDEVAELLHGRGRHVERSRLIQSPPGKARPWFLIYTAHPLRKDDLVQGIAPL
jgi:hypothetical protein